MRMAAPLRPRSGRDTELFRRPAHVYGSSGNPPTCPHPPDAAVLTAPCVGRPLAVVPVHAHGERTAAPHAERAPAPQGSGDGRGGGLGKVGHGAIAADPCCSLVGEHGNTFCGHPVQEWGALGMFSISGSAQLSSGQLGLRTAACWHHTQPDMPTMDHLGSGH